ncbi:A nuclease of the HNH/ENDO VII superfamily with conserved LHH [Lachnospiraceae bacterium A10]|nr:A nuclease of the HNH/ENDO VII superfamily with conserved LHH [Lachnospiraceae bacterium A10]
MSVVTGMIMKEVAKKAVEEKVKQQMTKELTKDVLKEKLKKAVKAEVKQKIQDEIVDEIDGTAMDVGAVKKTSDILKGDDLKGKLIRAAKDLQRGKVAIDATKSSGEVVDYKKNGSEVHFQDKSTIEQKEEVDLNYNIEDVQLDGEDNSVIDLENGVTEQEIKEQNSSEKDNIEMMVDEHSELNESDEVEKKNEGLTEDEKKDLKERTGWPDEIIDCINSLKEAEIYEKAGLKAVEIDGKWCLVRNDIDLDQKDEDGITNRERMKRGRPPITKDGKEVELHHIGQKSDSPLAELTKDEHRGTGNDTILHDKTKESEIDRSKFASERKEHWKNRVND